MDTPFTIQKILVLDRKTTQNEATFAVARYDPCLVQPLYSLILSKVSSRRTQMVLPTVKSFSLLRWMSFNPPHSAYPVSRHAPGSPCALGSRRAAAVRHGPGHVGHGLERVPRRLLALGWFNVCPQIQTSSENATLQFCVGSLGMRAASVSWSMAGPERRTWTGIRGRNAWPPPWLMQSYQKLNQNQGR